MMTARLFKFHLLWLTVSLPLLSTIAEAKNGATTAEERLQAITGAHLVRFANGYLSLRVEDVRLGELLDVIARLTGLTVVRYVALEQRVTLQFQRLPVEQGLRRILRHRSFVLEYAQPAPKEKSSAVVARPKVLWVLPQADEKYADQPRLVEPTGGGPSKEGLAKETAKLQIALGSEDAEHRQQAALELGESGRVEAVTPLSQALTDRSKHVRKAAVASLAEIGGTQAAQALHVALADQDPRVREAAVNALGAIGGDVAVGLLNQALADDVRFVREAAAEVLEELRGQNK